MITGEGMVIHEQEHKPVNDSLSCESEVSTRETAS